MTDPSVENIFNAVINNDYEYVEKYIQDYNDLEVWKDIYCAGYFRVRLTLFTTACYHKNFKIAKLLVKAGCDIDPKIFILLARGYYFYPIHMAIEILDYTFVKFLIDMGSNINAQCMFKSTPLMSCLRYLNYNDKKMTTIFNIMKLLILSGCRLDIKDNDGDDYKDYLHKNICYNKFKKEIDIKLDKLFRIRYSKSSLLELYTYFVKTNRDKYKICVLNRDLRKLITMG